MNVNELQMTFLFMWHFNEEFLFISIVYNIKHNTGCCHGNLYCNSGFCYHFVSVITLCPLSHVSVVTCVHCHMRPLSHVSVVTCVHCQMLYSCHICIILSQTKKKCCPQIKMNSQCILELCIVFLWNFIFFMLIT